jgi:hypothetical protein
MLTHACNSLDKCTTTESFCNFLQTGHAPELLPESPPNYVRVVPCQRTAWAAELEQPLDAAPSVVHALVRCGPACGAFPRALVQTSAASIG